VFAGFRDELVSRHRLTPYQAHYAYYVVRRKGGEVALKTYLAKHSVRGEEVNRALALANYPARLGRAELARRRALATDPASGRYRLSEERAALLLEQRTGPLQRDPTGASDWIDQQGHSYDAVGPVPVGRFDLAAFTEQIGRHLLKAGIDFVVVDVSGLSAAERSGVRGHVNRLRPGQRARVLVQP
jgi:hypothetical protein